MSQNTVFLSYRRANLYHAIAVRLALVERGYDVFFDYDSIDSGAFERVILTEVENRAHFVLILAPGALDRCHEPEDWVRREIERAIQRRRNVVPLLFDGFDYKNNQSHLHGKLRLLPDYNSVDVPRGYFNEAMERLHTRFLSIAPEDVMHPSPDDEHIEAERHFHEALTYYASGRIEAACKSLDAAIVQHDRFADAYYRRAQCRRVLGARDAAEADYMQALRLYPADHPRADLCKSGLHALHGDLNRALQLADHAVERGGDDPETLRQRGVLRQFHGDHTGAIADYSAALRLAPQDTVLLNNRGNAHTALNDYMRALADYDRAIRLNPDFATAYFNRGNVYFMRGDHKDAIVDFTHAIDLRPDYAAAYAARGLSQFHLKNRSPAIEDLEAAHRLAPHDDSIRTNLEKVRKNKRR